MRNQLLQIEAELGTAAEYAGRSGICLGESVLMRCSVCMRQLAFHEDSLFFTKKLILQKLVS